MALRQMGMARMGKYAPPVRSVAQGGKTGRPKLLHNGDGRGLLNHGGINIKGSAKHASAQGGIQRQLNKTKYATNKTNAHAETKRNRERAKREGNRVPSNPTPNTIAPGGAGGQIQQGTITAGQPMHQHPVGRFQYGAGQWGLLTKAGKVDWTAASPKGTERVLGFNEVLPYLKSKGMTTKMPVRKAAPMWYADSVYARQMAQHNAALAAAKARFAQDSAQQRFGYKNDLADLRLAQQGAVRGANAGLSANNLAGSGVAAATLGDIGSNFLDQLTRTTRGNQIAMTGLNTNLQGAQREYNTLKLGEIGVAKDRWDAINDGATPPAAHRGLWKQGVRQMRTTPDGIPMSWHVVSGDH